MLADKEIKENVAEEAPTKHQKRRKSKSEDEQGRKKPKRSGRRRKSQAENLLNVENKEIDAKLEERCKRRRKKKSHENETKQSESFSDPILARVISELGNDKQENDQDEGIPSTLDANNLPQSTRVQKVYTEKVGGGFVASNEGHKKKAIKVSSVSPTLKEEEELKAKEKVSPLDLGLRMQRCFRALGVFSHGFLAGLAAWHLVTVSNK